MKGKEGKTLPLIGASLWILGLALFLVGLNVKTDAGSWMSVIGNICFFLGLGIEGVYWVKSRKEKPADGTSGEGQPEK